MSLSEVLNRLLQNPDTQVRAIGQAPEPEALAARLTEAQIESLTRLQGGAFRVIDDTPIGF